MINKIKNNQHHQGQIAIIVLLASAILLTLGLSASRKTVTDTKIDVDEEALKEAFNTAESGINNYLLDNTKTQYTTTDGSVANIKVETIGGGTTLVSEGQVPVNTPQMFWLANHDTSGNIVAPYYTGSNLRLIVDSTFAGALKVDYFYIEAGVYKVQRFGCRYDGNTNSSLDNGFTGNCSTLTLPGNRLLLVVTPIVSSTNITLQGSSAFPNQGEELTSVGTAGNAIKTQIKTRNIYKMPSFFFDSVTAQNVIE